MKLTALLVLVFTIHATARVHSQEKVSLHVRQASLESVLRDICRQTGYLYTITDQYNEQSKRVDLSVDQVSVEQALNLVFQSQPFSYAIIEKTIVVKKKEEHKVTIEGSRNMGSTSAEGAVFSESGQPLSGASVTVKSNGKTTLTNEKGEFKLKDVPANDVLIISYIGYSSKQISFALGNKVTVYLQVAINELDQMQVIAYGSTTKRLNTGDVSSITSTEIGEQLVTNPLAAIEGRVSGMFITQSSGTFNSGISVQIRGKNSIANGNDPLYIIDGVPYISQAVTSQPTSPLAFLNPLDIQSIDILKDADATAIYGSRGANGVVLITTRKGNSGRACLDVNVRSGIGGITKIAPLLNREQYLTMRREAFKNDGVIPTTANAPDLLIWDTTRSTDWQKQLIGGIARYTDAQGTVGGGNANNQYLIGTTYHRETSVFPGTDVDQKISVHFNISSASTDRKFRIVLSGNYQYDQINGTIHDYTTNFRNLPPDAPTSYNTDGTLNWAGGTWTNPYANTIPPLYSEKVNNLISNAVLSYQLLPGLEIKSSLGYNMVVDREVIPVPIASESPTSGITTGISQFINENLDSWIVEPQLVYQRILGKGKLVAIAGGSFQKTNTIGQNQYATGFTSDALLYNLASASSISIFNPMNTIYRYSAGFGQLTYDWLNKYLLNLTGRRDGSSRFGPDRRFSDFGAIGAGWVFSKEGFVQRNLPFISYGKIRASYGTTGNDQIGDYKFLDNYGSTSYPYQGVQGLYPTNIYNPYYSWELNKKAEGALELGLLKDRVLLNMSYYYNRSPNQLVGYSLPSITGFTTVTANLPATVQNTGIELSLNTSNIKTKAFEWSTSVNLTIPHNKLVNFPNISKTSYASLYIVGQPITITRLYKYAGINDTTGRFQFLDSKGDLTYTPSSTTDKIATVNSMPILYGGFQNHFSYKNLQLDILFQFVKQNGKLYTYNVMPGYPSFNQPVNVLKRWQNSGDHTNVPKLSQATSGLVYPGYTLAGTSTYSYGDASFIRLKNLSLSYTLPARWLTRAHLQTFKVYVQAQNLLTITHYLGNDPENNANPTYLPPLRMIAVGFQLTL